MIGDSAGRAAGGRQRPTAQRRFTEQERQQNTPLPDDVQEWPDDDVAPERMAWIADIILAGMFVLLLTVGQLMANAGNWFVQILGTAIFLTTGLSGWFLAWNARKERRRLEERLRKAQRP